MALSVPAGLLDSTTLLGILTLCGMAFLPLGNPADLPADQ
ncbi:hypothetical protein IWX75_000583 [Arthrobacter sp. CAN_A6]